MIYCVDTSSLIAAWQERYPPDLFPAFWVRMDDLITEGRMIAPVDVLGEMTKRSEDLHAWLKARKGMFRELDEDVQRAAAEVLMRFPRLVGDKKLRTSADPFVIALARVQGLQVVTDEKPTGNPNKPNIPDVCAGFGMTCIGVLQLIRAEMWVIG